MVFNFNQAMPGYEIYYVCWSSDMLLRTCRVNNLYFTGAFGVVHKGELVTSDGVIKAVAIKTIKCKIF